MMFLLNFLEHLFQAFKKRQREYTPSQEKCKYLLAVKIPLSLIQRNGTADRQASMSRHSVNFLDVNNTGFVSFFYVSPAYTSIRDTEIGSMTFFLSKGTVNRITPCLMKDSNIFQSEEKSEEKCIQNIHAGFFFPPAKHAFNILFKCQKTISEKHLNKSRINKISF